MQRYIRNTLWDYCYPLYIQMAFAFSNNICFEEKDTKTSSSKKSFQSEEFIVLGYRFIFNVIPLSSKFFEDKPKKILVLDLDDTLLHSAKSALPQVSEPELLFEEKFQTILKVAKETGTLVIIGTARHRRKQTNCPLPWQASEVVKKIEKKDSPLIHAIIYCNNTWKKHLLTYLCERFGLNSDSIALVDDCSPHLQDAAQAGFLHVIHIFGEKPFEKILNFLNPSMKPEIEEPTTPVIQQYSFFSKLQRNGFRNLRTHVNREWTSNVLTP